MSKKRCTDGIRNPFCLAIFSVLLCATLPAQETAQPRRLSPDEAVEMAIKNNLGLESSRVSTATKKRASDLSWNQFIPNVTLGVGIGNNNSKTYLYNESDIPSMLLDAMREQLETIRWGIAGQIQASLTISVAMFDNIKRLQLDYEGGLVSYDKAKAQLERDVRKAYHNILLLQENIALLRLSAENVDRQVQMALANYDAGLAPELIYLQARVARENMRPAIDQAENGLKLMMAQFAMYLGLDYDTLFELIPVSENMDFIPLDVSEMISKASSGKPDIQELRQTILMLQSARKAQSHSLFPALSLNWNMSPFYFLKPKPETSINWTNPDASIINPSANITSQFSIMLGVRLHSLIPYSADYQGIKSIDDQITTANIGLAQLIRGTEIEVYNTVLALERTRISAEAQAQTISLAEQSYSLTEQAYRAGLQDYFQVQSAEQSLRQARVQMLEQQFNYLNGLIDLEYSIGVPFGTLSRSK
jgi:outer membrane protein TolC